MKTFFHCHSLNTLRRNDSITGLSAQQHFSNDRYETEKNILLYRPSKVNGGKFGTGMIS